ncbi:MAG: hypothetical protein PHD05_07160 [Sphaerochaetaceae bacterium]|nr:hypothetical protein [Sphaerochaetaceae bacterium]
MTEYIKSELVFLIPLLIGLGKVLKNRFSKTGQSSDVIPVYLLIVGIFVAIVYGFISSTYTGWKMVLDAVIMTGFVQGSIAAWTAMGVYDTTKKKESK